MFSIYSNLNKFGKCVLILCLHTRNWVAPSRRTGPITHSKYPTYFVHTRRTCRLGVTTSTAYQLQRRAENRRKIEWAKHVSISHRLFLDSTPIWGFQFTSTPLLHAHGLHQYLLLLLRFKKAVIEVSFRLWTKYSWNVPQQLFACWRIN
jgi:hypothetical protein